MSVEEKIYETFTQAERRIIDQWVASGEPLLQACIRLSNDLEDAAVEDGYDGGGE